MENAEEETITGDNINLNYAVKRSNNLTLNFIYMKKTLAIFLIAITIFGGCRKNDKFTSSTRDIPVISGLPENGIVISNAAIATWFAKNPVSNYLKPDWTKAEQAIIGGIPIVKVPIVNVTNTSSQVSAIKTQSLTTLANASPIANFDIKHPPALYFF